MDHSGMTIHWKSSWKSHSSMFPFLDHRAKQEDGLECPTMAFHYRQPVSLKQPILGGIEHFQLVVRYVRRGHSLSWHRHWMIIIIADRGFLCKPGKKRQRQFLTSVHALLSDYFLFLFLWSLCPIPFPSPYHFSSLFSSFVPLTPSSLFLQYSLK